MPYCNRCGDAINTGGIFCRSCSKKKNAQKQVKATHNAGNKKTDLVARPSQPVATAAITTDKAAIADRSALAKTVFDTTMFPHFKEFEINPDSGSLKITLNRDRIQCSFCDQWFYDKAALQTHRKRFKSGCGTHKQCFSTADIYVHAQRKEHQRCFVRGCMSKYHNQTGWSPEEIKAHVLQSHYPEGAEQ